MFTADEIGCFSTVWYYTGPMSRISFYSCSAQYLHLNKTRQIWSRCRAVVVASLRYTSKVSCVTECLHPLHFATAQPQKFCLPIPLSPHARLFVMFASYRARAPPWYKQPYMFAVFTFVWCLQLSSHAVVSGIKSPAWSIAKETRFIEPP